MEEKQRQRRREVEEIQGESHQQWQHSKGTLDTHITETVHSSHAEAENSSVVE